MIRRIALLLLAVVIGLGVQARDLTIAERDSVINALGTVWGTYLKNRNEKYTDKTANEEYLNGVKTAITAGADDSEFFYGLEAGVIICQRLDQVAQAGGFKIDKAKVLNKILIAARGGRTGFTVDTANDYMNLLMLRLSESADIENQSAELLSTAAKREGAITTPSGLVFEVLQEGEGESPTIDEIVEITYEGRLPDGSIFNDRQTPIFFLVREMIPGFAEGLMMMKPGGTYRLTIPCEIGYGETGVPDIIPPLSATQFDVHMINVHKIPDEVKSTPAPHVEAENE